MDRNIKPTKEQAEILAIDDSKNIRVLANAGAGKTTLLALKVKEILKKNPNIKKDQLYLITFTNSVVDSMKKKIGKSGMEHVRVTTLHSLVNRVLKELSTKGLITPYSIEEDNSTFTNGLRDALLSDPKLFNKIYPSTYKRYQDLKKTGTLLEAENILDRAMGTIYDSLPHEMITPFSSLKETTTHLRNSELYTSIEARHPDECAQLINKFAHLINGVNSNVNKLHVLNFNTMIQECSNLFDLNRNVIQILDQNPNHQFLERDKLFSRTPHINVSKVRELVDYFDNCFLNKIEKLLVDEFQDFSNAQYEFFKAVVNKDFSHHTKDTKECNFLVVGDPKQSIYQFQNAEPTFLATSIERDFPNLSTNYLSQTFRITNQNVVLLANVLAQVFMKDAFDESYATESSLHSLGDNLKKAKSTTNNNSVIKNVDDYTGIVDENDIHQTDFTQWPVIELLEKSLAEGKKTAVICRTNLECLSAERDLKKFLEETSDDMIPPNLRVFKESGERSFNPSIIKYIGLPNKLKPLLPFLALKVHASDFIIPAGAINDNRSLATESLWFEIKNNLILLNTIFKTFKISLDFELLKLLSVTFDKFENYLSQLDPVNKEDGSIFSDWVKFLNTNPFPNNDKRYEKTIAKLNKVNDALNSFPFELLIGEQEDNLFEIEGFEDLMKQFYFSEEDIKSGEIPLLLKNQFEAFKQAMFEKRWLFNNNTDTIRKQILQERTKEDMKKDDYLKNKANISFLTTHKAKGLEYDNVIIYSRSTLNLPQMIDPKPSKKKLAKKIDKFESFANLYVAMTRTKGELLLVNKEPVMNQTNNKRENFIRTLHSIVSHNPQYNSFAEKIYYDENDGSYVFNVAGVPLIKEQKEETDKIKQKKKDLVR